MLIWLLRFVCFASVWHSNNYKLWLFVCLLFREGSVRSRSLISVVLFAVVRFEDGRRVPTSFVCSDGLQLMTW